MNTRIARIASQLRIATLACGLSAALFALALYTFFPTRAGAASEMPSLNLKVDNAPPTREGRMNSYSPIVKRVAASVVRVDTRSKVRTPQMQLPPGFEQFMPFFNQQYGGGPRYVDGMGSGVIVTRDGYVLSNNHVVDGADNIKVTLDGGKEYTAKVVGRDPKTDIAVLKVDAKDLPAIDIANSDNIEVGDVVLAIGNPFGIGQTVTMGIVSAKSRGGMGIEEYEDFIQTDAAINPGNSGGALVDVQGRLIGINAAILSRSGGNQGIGFAVPINLARNVSESLMKNGRVVRGFLGVGIQNVDGALARKLELKETGGALITEVTPGSPAEKAGVKERDVVTEIDGRPVRDANSLRTMVSQKLPGSHVALAVVRDGAKRNLEVVLRERETGDDGNTPDATPELGAADTLKGVTVADLDRGARNRFRVPENVQGVLVTQVEPDSVAFETGLRTGDVILEINRKKVASADEAVKLTENQKDKTTLLRIWSRNSVRYLVVDENKSE